MRKIFYTISTSLFIVIILLILFTSNIDAQTEKNTTAYSATINNIYISNNEKKYIEIHVKEYTTNLYVSTNIYEKINISSITELKSGDLIFFRIQNAKTDQINNVEFVDIVSLSTESKTLFSLDDYNKFISEAALPTRVFCFVALLILMFLIFFINKGKRAKER